jgi:hypothetical protein
MVKHSASHAAASLAALLSSDLLARELERHLPIARYYVRTFAQWGMEHTGLLIDPGQVASALIALTLGTGWGMFFYMSQNRIQNVSQ